NALDPDFLRRLRLNPLTWDQACDWVNEGRLDAKTLGAEFLKVVAYHPSWETDPWMAELRGSQRSWARHLEFNENIADEVLGWLKDVRRFSARELGFDWLMRLAARSEPRYHDFAIEVMIKGFVPADFAEKDTAAKPQAAPAAKVDLGGATFLFTGK